MIDIGQYEFPFYHEPDPAKIPDQGYYEKLARFCGRLKPSGDLIKEIGFEFFNFEELKSFNLLHRSLMAQSFRTEKKLLYLGRDMWYFYVLAIRDNLASRVIFDPRISRNVSSWHAAGGIRLPYSQENFILVDTGFSGTIPRNLKFAAENVLLLSTGNKDFSQVTSRNVRELVIKLEDKSESFWESGIVWANNFGDEEIQQPTTQIRNMMEHLMLSWQFYTNYRPR